MEPATNTVDVTSSTGMEPGAAPGEGNEHANNDKKVNKSEPASNVATEPTLKQDMNETRINQPVQTASDLKITAKGVPMEVRLANDGRYCYEYNRDEYAVTTTANGSTFEAEVHLILNK